MLKLNFPNLVKRDLYNIQKGSFCLKNLVYLQVYFSRLNLFNIATIKNRKLILKRPTTSHKVYKNKEVWFTKFINYIVIINTLYIYPINFYIKILLQINKIHNYSATYNQTSILNLIFNYYRYIMDYIQLKPSN